MMDGDHAGPVTQENRRAGGTALSVCEIRQQKREFRGEIRWQLHDVTVSPDDLLGAPLWMRNQFHGLTGIHWRGGIQFEPPIRIADGGVELEEGVILTGILL